MTYDLNWHGDRKEFAIKLMNSPNLKDMKGILFKIADGHEPLEVVKNYVASNIGTLNGIESIRHMIGMEKWIY